MRQVFLGTVLRAHRTLAIVNEVIEPALSCLKSIMATVYKCDNFGLKRPLEMIETGKYFAFEDPVCN